MNKGIKHMKPMATACLLAGLLFFSPIVGQADTGKAFKTPKEAAQALSAAVSANDDKALRSIFGDKFDELLGTKDPATIKETHRLLKMLFSEHWTVSPTEDGKRIVRLGKEGWPLPIPLVQTKQGWAFDSAAGVEEVHNRRVGRNELITIETLQRLMDAQEEYHGSDWDGDGVREYAAQIPSSEGKKDGLYWKIKKGQKSSPMQHWLLDSWKYAEGRVKGAPWFGYRYRVLLGQGPKAAGGAFEYVINGHQVAGYAFVAYPAAYGTSGVMTFMVNQNGVIFQKDMGADTEKLAEGLKVFEPGEGWDKVDDI